MAPEPLLRKAREDDLSDLVRIEERSFDRDRISRRSFRYLLARPTATTIVAELDGRIAGYTTILFRAGTSLARLYSIAVDPDLQASGIGSALLCGAEESAYAHDRMWLRLEVRSDNASAIAFYHRHGYRQIGRYGNYYDDGCDALRLEKILKGHESHASTVPFYEQSEDFTCGAACLLMAMAAYIPETRMDAVEEIRLWREATTVFMMSGPGGCEPYGMAVTAAEHGLLPRIVCSHEGPLFLDTVRSEEKRRVMRLAQTGFRQKAESLGIVSDIREPTLTELRREIAAGGVAAVLVSGYRMFDKKVPHWVLAHGDDGRHIIIHDPWVEEEQEETVTDAANLPIPYAVFERMARFGTRRLRATVFLKGNRQ